MAITSWAIIVCYFPCNTLLSKLMELISPQVGRVLIMNNGGLPQEVASIASEYNNISIHNIGENVGIATALNMGFSIASDNQVEFCITFDQDSLPSSNMVDVLIKDWRHLNATSGRQVGAIGPSFYDDRNGILEYPFHRLKGSGFRVEKLFRNANDKKLTPVDMLITSGMLVPVSMWQSGIKFKDDLFIDYVDTEWCFRSKNYGFQHYGCFNTSMRHQISEQGINILGSKVFRYSAIRRYYYHRNTIFFLRWSYVPLGNRIRIALSLAMRFLSIPFLDKNPIASIGHALLGIIDGFQGTGGRLNSDRTRFLSIFSKK
jgi:rhamnosyltransferase